MRVGGTEDEDGAAVKLSKESEYGLIGVLYLAAQPEGAIRSAGEVAEMTGVAYPFLAKIFNRLARGGILVSYRGRSRGYALARPAEAINVKAVIEAIEGPNLFRHCVFWSNACADDHPCVMHEVWRRVRPQMAALMEQTSVAELAHLGSVGGDAGWTLRALAENGAATASQTEDTERATA
jgi:Rrf2 family iron-sulfur cluster assembly transcriptional regulator